MRSDLRSDSPEIGMLGAQTLNRSQARGRQQDHRAADSGQAPGLTCRPCQCGPCARGQRAAAPLCSGPPPIICLNRSQARSKPGQGKGRGRGRGSLVGHVNVAHVHADDVLQLVLGAAALGDAVGQDDGRPAHAEQRVGDEHRLVGAGVAVLRRRSLCQCPAVWGVLHEASMACAGRRARSYMGLS